jgi:hypothetical protein
VQSIELELFTPYLAVNKAAEYWAADRSKMAY